MMKYRLQCDVMIPDVDALNIFEDICEFKTEGRVVLHECVSGVPCVPLKEEGAELVKD